MKRRTFFAAASALAAASCARMEKRSPRYDPSECPFCSVKPGVCSYCNGTTKCPFCGGRGIRRTGTPTIADAGIKATSYEEKCPYCKASGVCRYCEGSGKCWACDGTGRVTSWDFYEKYRKLVDKKQQ